MKKIDEVRKELEGQICQEYLEILEEGELRPTAVMARLAAKYGYTLHGIRKMLIRAGSYVPKEVREED